MIKCYTLRAEYSKGSGECATFYMFCRTECMEWLVRIHIWTLLLRRFNPSFCTLESPLVLYLQNYKSVNIMWNLTFMCTNTITRIYSESIFKLRLRLLLANFYVITEKTEIWFKFSSFGGMTLTENKWLLSHGVRESQWIKGWGNYCATQPGFVQNKA